MGTGATVDAAALFVASSQRAAAADPLARYQCASWGSAEVIAAMRRGDEALWHAGNSGSKTTGGLAVTLAFLQGRESIADWDGTPIPLPLIRPPVSWVLGVESFKLAAESTLPKLRELLGDWDKHETREGGPDTVTRFLIRHRLSRRESDWSRLSVFSYEGPDPEAARLDGWQCDEPAPASFIDALRNRGKAGRPLYGFHTLTPIKRKDWEPIFADFPEEHLRPVNGRVRIQSSVYDNRALHLRDCRHLRAAVNGRIKPGCQCPDILRAERAVQSSPYRQARLFGDPVDIADTCPFDTERLTALRGEAEEGTRYGFQWVSRDGRDVLLPEQHPKGVMECWGWPKEGDIAVFIADPSSGVKDPDKSDAQQPRNPAGLVGLSLQGNCDFLRFNGYIRAHELGQMARAATNRCPEWVLVHERGGYGDAFLRGFEESPGITRGQLWFDTDPITGKLAKEPGWTQSTTGLGKLMSSLQRAFEDGAFRVRSRAAIDNFLRTRLDKNERWDRGDGKGPHGEDVIVYGIGTYVLERLTLPRRRTPLERVAGIKLPQANGHAATVERW